MRLQFVRALGALAILTLSLGCAKYFTGKYLDGVATNRSNVQQLRLAMSRAEVVAKMGEGEIVRYERIHLLNPWRSEAFFLRDEHNTRVEILYYLTEPQVKWGTLREEEITPVVLENDLLVGWGWSYLRRNTDRYGISTPHEQL